MNYFPIKIMCRRIWDNYWKIESKYYRVLRNYNIFLKLSDELEQVFLTEYYGTIEKGKFCRELNLLVEHEGDTPPTDLVKLKLLS